MDGINDPIHRCPVCKNALAGDSGIPLSMADNLRKYKRDSEKIRKKKEDQWDGRIFRQRDDEAVVAATCGELFHKACLFNYCSREFNKSIIGKRPSNAKKSVVCPRCTKKLMVSYYRPVDIEGHMEILRHKGKSLAQEEKEFHSLRLIHDELNQQHRDELKRLKKAQLKLETAQKELEQLKKKNNSMPNINVKEKFGDQCTLQRAIQTMQQRKEAKRAMELYIQRAQRVIDFMHKETPNTMRLYLKKVQLRPVRKIADETPIPRMLIPHLEQMCEDLYCLFALSQVIAPTPYPGIDFSKDQLLLGILKKVNPSLGDKLAKRAKRCGVGVLEAYDQMFPDTCLQILDSITKEDILQENKPENLDITIMYMMDDEGSQEEQQDPNPNGNIERLLAPKGVNCYLSSSASSNESVAISHVPPLETFTLKLEEILETQCKTATMASNLESDFSGMSPYFTQELEDSNIETNYNKRSLYCEFKKASVGDVERKMSQLALEIDPPNKNEASTSTVDSRSSKRKRNSKQKSKSKSKMAQKVKNSQISNGNADISMQMCQVASSSSGKPRSEQATAMPMVTVRNVTKKKRSKPPLPKRSRAGGVMMRSEL